MNRRDFIFSLIALPSVLSETSLRAAASEPALFQPLAIDGQGRARFLIQDLLEHPYYWWPRTLLTYPVQWEGDLAAWRKKRG